MFGCPIFVAGSSQAGGVVAVDSGLSAIQHKGLPSAAAPAISGLVQQSVGTLDLYSMQIRASGQPERAGFLERDGGAHQCELIMINDEALVQTKSLSTQLSLTTNQRNPGCLAIAGNTGNVVCNTSFTDLSDSRVKTEIAEADAAELKQLFDSVEAKQYKRPDMNGDLRLGFASDDFAGKKWKNLTGTTRWSDGTQRDLANDFNVRDPRKLYQLERQRDHVTQAMAFEALKADMGRQVQAPRRARWASLVLRGERPVAGRPY